MVAPTGFSVIATSHTGITVSSISRALEFWEGVLGSEVIYRNHDVKFSEKLNIVGVQDAVLNLALLRLPNGNSIELLEYSAPANRKVFKPRPCDVGSVHVAFDVKGSRALIEQASRLGWTAAADEPQRLVRGDGTVWTAIYIFGPDGEAVELLEKLEE